jgi:secreted PhoX family phosphatase
MGTGVASSALGKGPMARLGNNALLACNPASGEVRRFLSAPVHAAFGGLAFTPDGRTLFATISHPGEAPGEGPDKRNMRNDPAAPRRYSNWPDFKADGRPRSAVLAVRRDDGGVIGG